jgi:hypothetical protein
MKYEITIQARITKTYDVEAENEDLAYDLAHDEFSSDHEDTKERDYEIETLRIREFGKESNE